MNLDCDRTRYNAIIVTGLFGFRLAIGLDHKAHHLLDGLLGRATKPFPNKPRQIVNHDWPARDIGSPAKLLDLAPHAVIQFFAVVQVGVVKAPK